MKLIVVGRTRSHQIGGENIYFGLFYSCNLRLLPELPKKLPLPQFVQLATLGTEPAGVRFISLYG